MHDHVAGVDQDPVTQGHALYSDIAGAVLLQPFDQPIGNRTDMTLGTARGDNHVIANGCLARQIDADDIVSLGVLKSVDDKMCEGVGDRSSARGAVRGEFRELLFQRIKPQRESPSIVDAPMLLRWTALHT